MVWRFSAVCWFWISSVEFGLQKERIKKEINDHFALVFRIILFTSIDQLIKYMLLFSYIFQIVRTHIIIFNNKWENICT